MAASTMALASGCSSSTTSSAYEAAGNDRGPSNAADVGGSSSGKGTDPGSPAPGVTAAPGTVGTPGDTGQAPIVGQLTAGVWDDNLNFDFFSKYITTLGARPGLPIFGPSERLEAKNRAFAPRQGVSELDVAFVVDTTGSMADELRYVQKELSAIAGNIATRFPGTTPRFGLVFYRDHGDQYLTRSFDFATDLQTVQANLDAQATGGGGDFPEAVPEGLSQATDLSWRPGAVARLAFWIADAPAHSNESQATRAAIDKAVQKDVHVYPVAASGADELTEGTMRSAAQITGGRYLFLTNDSGVGGDHKEPSIPCYNVTKFSSAMVRVIEGEMKGTRIEPQAGEVLRSVGNPQDGKCTLASQEQVVIY
jgi:hypothetical protein